jgi:hypothetical protein
VLDACRFASCGRGLNRKGIIWAQTSGFSGPFACIRVKMWSMNGRVRADVVDGLFVAGFALSMMAATSILYEVLRIIVKSW